MKLYYLIKNICIIARWRENFQCLSNQNEESDEDENKNNKKCAKEHPSEQLEKIKKAKLEDDIQNIKQVQRQDMIK